MGRPYAKELTLLSATYAHALAADIAWLRESVDALRARPIIVVGSGGSVSACHVTARLHESRARLSARVLTPLEFVRHPVPQEAGVLLLSASGKNPDIIAAALHAIEAEYAPVVSLSTRPQTALRSTLAPHRHATAHEFVGPSAKDGFLATNSLLLTCALLARAYGCDLPLDLPSLRASKYDAADQDSAIIDALMREGIVMLASAWSLPAAYDAESKWAESGFGAVTVTDARNFAHGRHHGLSQRLEETAVVGLATSDESDLTERTLKGLPRVARSVFLRSSLPDVAGALDLLVRIIRLTGDVGTRQGIDPGRPHVLAFGRRLYNAGIPRRTLKQVSHGTGLASGKTQRTRVEDLWIRRKVTVAVWEAASAETQNEWRERCRAWVQVAESSRIAGVVVDYDGTLCEADERFGTPTARVGDTLTRLIDDGMVVGVATGRGGSVLDALRAILPERLWANVIIGMYNGGVVCRLTDQPKVDTTPDAAIEAARMALEASPVLGAVARIRPRPTQLTVRSAHPLPDGVLQRFVLEALGIPCMDTFPVPGASSPTMQTTVHAEGRAVSVFASGHTVDVIARRASKLRVVEAVRDVIIQDSGRSSGSAGIMTIGDQGQLGGNDCEFLAHPMGLSVERVSSVFDACWNVAPAGARRTAVLLTYLDALQADGPGTFRWSTGRAQALSSVEPEHMSPNCADQSGTEESGVPV